MWFSPNEAGSRAVRPAAIETLVADAFDRELAQAVSSPRE
jgi:hypothetical protein